MRTGTLAETGVTLWAEEGGSGSPTLVLLHGLGANADVWEGMKRLVRKEWPGRWVIPDLRGHGRSEHRGPYGYAGHGADVAALFAQHEEVVAVGHSMGGIVAVALATGWYGVKVRHVVAFGVKIHWTSEEVTKLHALAKSPVRWFDTEAEAIDRYLKVSGLIGLVDPASPAAKSGVRKANGRFRLASDPGINGAAGPAVAPFVAAAQAPIRFAAGAKDPMCALADMQPFDAHAHIFEGAGHNVHVERPDELWRFILSAVG
jgi:pimeloyl-ACP methyl ester carboxylesterase